MTHKPSPLATNDSFSDFHSSPHKQLSDDEPSFLADLSKSRHLPNKSSTPATNESDFWEDSLASQRLPPTGVGAALGSDTEDLSLHQITVDTSVTSVMDTPVPRHYQRKPAIPTHPTATGLESRIPSLTRSEVSGTDHEATTPENHDRVISSAAALPDSDISGDASHSVSAPDFGDLDQTRQAGHSDEKSTPASSQTVTPAVMRYMDAPDTAVRAAATPFGIGAALRDVTRRHANNANNAVVPSTPFTPSVDYNKTPRAALDDAERRKNHVLSVLSSSTLPSRVKRFTPHPRRHVSVGPEAESIAEEPSFLNAKGGEESLSINESFISVASSQDLTPDRRGSRAFSQRANTSVPNILYSGAAAASPGVSHLDNRPDTVKIQKHLNMMNQQLLDNNADLAREAEEWRSECTRLIGIMRETGIPIDDDGNVLGELPKLQDVEQSLDLPAIADTSRSPADVALSKQVEELRADLLAKDEEMSRLLKATPTQDDVLALRTELEESRSAHEALKAEFAQKTKDHTSMFTEICAEFEDQVQQLETQVRQLEEELDRARAHATPVVAHAESISLHEKVQRLEGELEQTTDEMAGLRAEVEVRASELQVSHDCCADLEERLAAARGANGASALAIEAAEKARASASAERDAALEEVEELRDRLADMDQVLTTKQAVMEEQRESLRNLEDLADREHKDLEETQGLLRDARRELNEVHSRLSEKDQQIETLRGQADVAMLEKSSCLDDLHATEVENSIIGALEERLEAAYKDIGRLKHEAQATPIHQSTLEARDARISALETEKLALMERLKAHQVSSPARWSNSMMTSTPLHKTVTSLKYPSTPGPLKDVSVREASHANQRRSHGFKVRLGTPTRASCGRSSNIFSKSSISPTHSWIATLGGWRKPASALSSLQRSWPQQMTKLLHLRRSSRFSLERARPPGKRRTLARTATSVWRMLWKPFVSRWLS